MKHRANRRRMSNKKFIAILSVFVMLALTMVVGCAVDGTVAWLVSESESSVSTFTLGDINIKLTEAESESQPLKIIPGVKIERSLKVTVEPNSEACWLFVKVEGANWSHFPDANGTAKVSYSVDVQDGWTALNNHPGVYYREVSAEAAQEGAMYDVNCNVTVSQMLTKAEVNSIASGTQPKLSFTAYAVQRDGIDDAVRAWEVANPAPANP